MTTIERKTRVSAMRAVSSLFGLALGAAVLTAGVDAARAAEATAPPAEKAVLPPVVSVLAATKSEMVDVVLVTGTLIAREEILVGPEIEGLRIVELLVDEGEKANKGQVLARLARESLDAQMAQSLATQIEKARLDGHRQSLVRELDQDRSSDAVRQSLGAHHQTVDYVVEEVLGREARLWNALLGIEAHAHLRIEIAQRGRAVVPQRRPHVRRPRGGARADTRIRVGSRWCS